jgi:hypothetical protein
MEQMNARLEVLEAFRLLALLSPLQRQRENPT